MKKILPILLGLLGTGAGVGAGMAMMPSKGDTAPVEQAAAAPVDCAPTEAAKTETAELPELSVPPSQREYIKMNNQFIVPLIENNRVRSLIVASLSVEVDRGDAEIVYRREPKLRDVFLQVLMEHANVGGFDGNFTDGQRMRILRQALSEAARPVMGGASGDVLITEIARQDN